MNILTYALISVLRDMNSWLENEYLIKLNEIKTVLENKRLSDCERIEEILCIFECMDIEVGSRSNFNIHL